MKNVSKKLLKAIEKVGGKIEKTGWNNYSKYHYITESDVNNAILPALLEQGLLHTTSVENVTEEPSTPENKNRFTRVFLKHTITDVESGEQLVLNSAGTAADTLDKSIYKALTGSCKYFWLKTFLISGDDSDPENDGVVQKPASNPTNINVQKSFTQKTTSPTAQPKEKEVKEEVAQVPEPAIVNSTATPKTTTKPSFREFKNIKLD